MESWDVFYDTLVASFHLKRVAYIRL
jgi:hypothetical protein